MVNRRNDRVIDRPIWERHAPPPKEPRFVAVLATYSTIAVIVGALIGFTYSLHETFLGPYLRGLIIALERGI